MLFLDVMMLGYEAQRASRDTWNMLDILLFAAYGKSKAWCAHIHWRLSMACVYPMCALCPCVPRAIVLTETWIHA